MSIKKILYIFIIYLKIFNIIYAINYISFNFNRNLTENLEGSDLMSELFHNNIYSNIEIGTPIQNIPVQFKLQNYPFFIIDNEEKNINCKKYNYFLSSTYEDIENIELDFEECVNASKSIENFNIFNKKLEKINFLNCKKIFEKTYIREGGVIGLNLDNGSGEHTNILEYNFIKILKQNDVISDYYFNFNFDKNSNPFNTNGNIVFGALPHEIGDKRYKLDNYKIINAASFQLKINWAFEFETFQIFNKFNNSIINYTLVNNAYLYPEIGFIIAPNNYLNDLNEIFFNKLKENECVLDEFETNDLFNFKNNKILKFYKCNKNINLKNFPIIKFYHKQLDKYFEFDSNDLFFEYKNNIYFNIVFQDNLSYFWYLGLPFFKKYDIYFNWEKKTIGIYTKFENIKNKYSFKKFIIVIFIFLIIAVIILSYLLYKHVIIKRQTRANELLEYVEYKENDKQNNKLGINN